MVTEVWGIRCRLLCTIRMNDEMIRQRPRTRCATRTPQFQRRWRSSLKSCLQKTLGESISSLSLASFPGASSLTPCCLHDSHHATGTATHTMLQSEQLTPGCRHSSSYHVADTVVHTMLSKPAHLFLPSLLSPSFFSFLPTNVRHPSIPQLYTYTHPTDLHAQSLTHALSPQLH